MFSNSTFKVIFILGALISAPASGKLYGRCELALELLTYHNIPRYNVATWICIAQHASGFETSSQGPSHCHGLFKICQNEWCEVNQYGGKCNMICGHFLDDSIGDDVHCAKIVYRTFFQKEGDGFKGFGHYVNCTGDTSKYLEGCFS